MNNRVCLINPPTRGRVEQFPLGLAYLSSVLRHNGYNVKIIDAAAPYNQYSNEQIKKEILDYEPLFIGITLTVDFISVKYELINELKKLNIPIVAGGPHVNILPEEPFKMSNIDIVAVGEGEEIITEIADYFNGKGELKDIHGLGYRQENGAINFNPARKPIKDLDKLPFPDYDDFPIKTYTGVDDPASDPIYFKIFSSRGCPFNCLFCSSNNIFGKSYRLRSAKNVFDEVLYLINKYGAQSIGFQDNEPLIDKKRISDFCDMIINNNIKIKMSCRSRIDSVDKDLLIKMAKAGLRRITYGIESGDNETLKKINKHYKADIILKSFETIAKADFPVISFNNIIGFPWETERHISNTVKMNEEVPDTINYFANVVTPVPFPGTKLYSDYYEKYGFKDWWLDPKNHQSIPPTYETKPFYMNFTPSLFAHDMKVDFWKWDKRIRKKIIGAKLKIHLLYLRRKLDPFTLYVLINLCRLSVWADQISTRLERFMFLPLNRIGKKLSGRIKFTKQ